MNKHLETARTLMRLELPLVIQDKLHFIFKDGDEGNWNSKNVTYWFSDGPCECPFIPGSYYIPGFSRYAINETGEIRRVRDGHLMSFVKFVPIKASVRGGYMGTSLTNDFGARRTNVGRHRLLMMALRPLPLTMHPSERIINHKNGIGGDDCLDNLEWCTYGENVQHAYDAGLHPNKVRAVSLWNWITDEKLELPSVVAAVEYTGLSFSKCVHRMDVTNDRRHEDGWRLKDPDKPWLPLRERVGQSIQERAVVYFNPVTGEGGRAHSACEAARLTGVAQPTLSLHANNYAHVPTFGYLFRYEDSFECWPTFTEQQLEIFKAHPMNVADGVEVYDMETNETLFFTSIPLAGVHFGISPVTIGKLARYEGTRHNRHRFKLVRVRERF